MVAVLASPELRYITKQNLYVWHSYFHVVEKVENSIAIDKQGRLVLPSHIREALGLKDGGHATIRLDGSRIILEPASKSLKEKVQEWASLALTLKAEAFAEEFEESWKWMSREYARRKLGVS
jgi:AbrB family looped-hinge helix DNA binding protein